MSYRPADDLQQRSTLVQDSLERAERAERVAKAEACVGRLRA